MEALKAAHHLPYASGTSSCCRSCSSEGVDCTNPEDDDLTGIDRENNTGFAVVLATSHNKQLLGHRSGYNSISLTSCYLIRLRLVLLLTGPAGTTIVVHLCA